MNIAKMQRQQQPQEAGAVCAQSISAGAVSEMDQATGQAARWPPGFRAELNFCSLPAGFILSLNQAAKKKKKKSETN